MTTAIVVTHNSSAWIRRCIAALDGIPVIVVDNASTDGTVSLAEDARPGVHLIRRKVNGGFAVAVNQALARTEGDVLLVNPDVIVDRDGVASLERYLAAYPHVGVVVPVLQYPDGRLQESIRTFPSPLTLLARRSPFGRTALGRRLLHVHILQAADLTKSRPIEWAIGAVLMLRREAVSQVGGFDEGFFLYGEDVDLCHRLWSADWEVHVEPGAAFEHEYVRSSRRTLDVRSRTTRLHWASILRLFWRHPGLLVGRKPRRSTLAIERWRDTIGGRATSLSDDSADRQPGSTPSDDGT
ncbi:MAG: glycosyltransferase family 2 protein [Chloroflexi bacterium]|nr:glycosyltransferase family 2 protein [Chloroflexota bacterium]